jgi:hypothetical protein
MLDVFNSGWGIIIALIIFCIILRKLYYMNEPFDQTKFVEQFKNQKKLKKQFNLDIIKKGLPTLASYYVGLH